MVGTKPEFIGARERWLITAPAYADECLLKALEDPRRWVVAHVILTERHLGPVPEKLDAAYWERLLEEATTGRWREGYYNGLYVDLKIDATPIFDDVQRPAIREYWIQRFKKEGLGKP
jgi:hypothetical protein